MHRVLIVEDEVSLREGLADLFCFEGFEVHLAANGQEALEALYQGLQPSVILLDLSMPVMDGMTFLSIKNQHPQLAGIPTILCSAALNVLDPPGAAAKLAKPVDIDELLTTVRKVIAE